MRLCLLTVLLFICNFIHLIPFTVSTADASDYDMNANSRVIFSAGDTSGTVRCTSPNISITQDSLPEGTEQFLISLQFSLSFNFGFLTLVTAIIDDDDDGKLCSSAAV